MQMSLVNYLAFDIKQSRRWWVGAVVGERVSEGLVVLYIVHGFSLYIV